MSDQQPNYNITPIDADQKIIGLTFRPTPSDRELDWDRSRVLLSKTDDKGNILYANESFIDVSGYDDFELMNKSHNILRHPDMPKVIFKLLWENISRGDSYMVIMKNMSKTGRYYWVLNDIKAAKDGYGLMTFTGQQHAVNPEIINKVVEPLFKKLLHIEQASGIQSSENYLIGFLEEKGKGLAQFFNDLTNSSGSFDSDSNDDDDNEQSSNNKGPVKKKGFFSGFFADTPDSKKK